jgi:hypothetical protein
MLVIIMKNKQTCQMSQFCLFSCFNSNTQRKKMFSWWGMVVQICNPAYSGGKNQNYHSSRSTWGKKLQDLSQQLTRHRAIHLPFLLHGKTQIGRSQSWPA